MSYCSHCGEQGEVSAGVGRSEGPGEAAGAAMGEAAGADVGGRRWRSR